MTEEAQEPQASSGPGKTAAETSWTDVGQQFQELGESLAQAFRSAWEDEQNQRRLQDMRSGLESMVREVGQAIDDTANSPQGQKIRAEAGRTVEALRSAGEQTAQEVRPQLINALQQLNAELQKLIERMEKRKSPPGPPEEGPGAGI
jgi:hypothetical protein